MHRSQAVWREGAVNRVPGDGQIRRCLPRRRILVRAGALLGIVSCLLTLRATAAESVAIPTFTPVDYVQILDGSYKRAPATISGSLFMPTASAAAVPAVVLMPGSGGIRDDIELPVAHTLQAAGIAALLVDNYRGRGLSETATDQGRLPLAATVLDAFQSLIALREVPGIDPARIGIAGFSRGGVAAIFAGQEQLLRAALNGAAGYKALAAIFPGCATQWDAVRPSAAPMLFLLGEKDDLTPAEKCRRYAARINEAGGTARVIVYPGAAHSFLSSQQKWIASAANFAACDMTVTPDGATHYPKLGIRVGDDWPAFAAKVFKDCGTKGFTRGGTEESRRRALADLTGFFLQALAP